MTSHLARRRAWRDQRGLTLTELLITLSLIGLVASGLFASMRAMSISWATGQHRIGVTQHGRNAMEWMARRVRLAGQGTPGSTAIYVAAEAARLGFWADVIPGSGASGSNPMDYILYEVSGGRLIETITAGATTSVRKLTAAEEVGIITVTSVNFCYYDIFNTLLDQTATTAADGTWTCAGAVSSNNLGNIYKVKIRLALTSGRPGEAPLVLNTVIARRLEVMP